jgi:rod shape-determining protein MreD
MKPRVYLLLLLVLTPVQASLLAPFTIKGIMPDLGLAVLYTIGLLTSPLEGALAGVAVGLLQDIASASLIGFSGMTRGLVGLLAGLLGRRVLDVASPSNILFICLFSLIESVLTAVFMHLFYGDLPFFGLFFGRMVPQALYAALIGYGIVRFATDKKVLGALRRRELQKES